MNIYFSSRIWSIILLTLFLLLNSQTYSVMLTDIKKHWAKNEIQNLVSEGIITGYDTNRDGIGDIFKPDAKVKRAEVITIIVRALKLAVEESKEIFSDVPLTHWANKYVTSAFNKNIIKLTDAATLKPNEEANRAEITTMIIRALGKEDEVKELLEDKEKLIKEATFRDVEVTHQYSAYIIVAAKYGIVTGYKDGTFKPDKKVSRAETAVLISRMLTKKEKLVQLKEGVYTGLIIDARGYEVGFSMSPKIVNENDEEIYPKGIDISIDELQEKGILGYYGTIDDAKQKRVGNNPLIIKAIAVKGALKSTFVVTNEDAEMILRESKNYNFLKDLKVAIIK